jgi:5-methyltetrahydrofolate--homocysteine methyltransferase
MGTMLAGQTIEALWASLRHAKPLAFGMNCATGPEFMTDHIRTLSQLSSEYLSCYPNAGLPDEEGKYLETPTTLAAQLEKFADHGWLNFVGGCCGTAYSCDCPDGGEQEAATETSGIAPRSLLGD